MSVGVIGRSTMLKASYVEVGVSRGPELSSKLIGYFGGGYWSHAYNLLPFGTNIEPGTDVRVQNVLDARYDRVGGRQPGVHVRPISYLEHCERLIIRIPAFEENAAQWLAEGRGQLGKPYDPIGILRLASGDFSETVRDWRDTRQWFCSELDMWMLERGKIIHRLGLAKGLYTPGDVVVAGSAVGNVVAHLKPGERYARA